MENEFHLPEHFVFRILPLEEKAWIYPLLFLLA